MRLRLKTSGFKQAVFQLEIQYYYNLYEDNDMQCTSSTNFLHKKNSYLHALQKNREMGARYLDPKYSRWISVDPALGEYVPQAPVNDEAKRHNQNLPGMGGVFNSVNLNLFHYAGNNPVRYMDPDGMFDIKPDFGNDALFYFKSTIRMICVPLGGGYSQDQKEIKRVTSSVQALVNVGISLGNSKILNNLATGVSLFSDMDACAIIKAIAETVLSETFSRKLPGLGTVFSIRDLAEALFDTPVISSTNYWESEQAIGNEEAVLTQIGLEQAFSKTLCEKLEENGILYSVEKEGGLIMNISVWQDAFDYNQVYDIANELRNSSPIYSSILIFQE